MEFVSPGVDRPGLLKIILEENGLPCHALHLAGTVHLCTWAGRERELRWPRYGTVFTAHYDRTADSPGANDNGAAIFQLVEAALSLGEQGPLFIFTGGEELSSGEELKNQGSRNRGLFLRERSPGARIFCFDACGTGDTLVISTAAEELLKNEGSPGADTARLKTQELRAAALEAARRARLEKVMLLPTPFSEDSGFLLSGMSSQTITVLPREEAAAFASLVRRRGNAAAFLLSSAAAPPADRRLVPETWRCLNGPSDSPLRLTVERWKTVVAFALALGTA